MNSSSSSSEKDIILYFKNFLMNLKNSKELINKATKIAIKNMDYSTELFLCILEKIKEISTLECRISLLYLLDNICKTAKKLINNNNTKKNFKNDYLELIESHLKEIISLLLEEEKEGNTKEKNNSTNFYEKRLEMINTIKKVLKIWLNKNIFEKKIIEEALLYVKILYSQFSDKTLKQQKEVMDSYPLSPLNSTTTNENSPKENNKK